MYFGGGGKMEIHDHVTCWLCHVTSAGREFLSYCGRQLLRGWEEGKVWPSLTIAWNAAISSLGQTYSLMGQYSSTVCTCTCTVYGEGRIITIAWNARQQSAGWDRQTALMGRVVVHVFTCHISHTSLMLRLSSPVYQGRDAICLV